jgi:hypothetical protein
MKTLLITGLFMMGLLWTQDADAQEHVKIQRKSEVVNVFDFGNAVRNSFQHLKFCTEQTVSGVGMILCAPFTRHPERLPLFKKYRYYEPLYIPGRWEKLY